jgi:hypothetical protein
MEKNITSDGMTKKQEIIFDKMKEELFKEYLENVAAAREEVLNRK